jgi:hypothetical protein
MAVEYVAGGADIDPMRAGIASISCLGVVFLLVWAHGASGGSDGFWAFWYLLVATAVVLAVIAIFSAARTGISRHSRVIALVTGLATIGVTAFFAWAIVTALEHLN